MRQHRGLSLAVCLLYLFFVSCSTDYNKQMQKSEQTFYQGKYKEAARALLPLVNKSNKDQLLFMMECGLMLHAAGDFENSNQVLLKAAELSEEIATSVSKQAASLLLNETTTNYKGEDFERVLIHMYLGINFLMLSKPDEARVEFKKVNVLLRDINESGGRTYKQNIMAKYLTAIAFEIAADMDNDENDREFAYIEYKQIYALDPRLDLVKTDLQRLARQLDDSEDYAMWRGKFGKRDNIPKDAGELIVIYQGGLGAIKKSRGSILKDRNMNTAIRVSFQGMPAKTGVTLAGILLALKLIENPIPKFVKRSNKVDHIALRLDNQYLGKTTLLEDIETTAVKNMQEQYTRLYQKVAAGVVLKAVASVAAAYAAKKIAEQSKKTEGIAGLIGFVTGAIVGGGLASQIKPDLRCWHTLPATLNLARFYIKPGTYEVSVQLTGKNGQLIETRKHSVTINKGQRTFFNYRTLF